MEPNQDDYKNDPEARELQERSRPDEMALYNKLGEVLTQLLNNQKNMSVLDMCCGTGPSMEIPSKHKNCGTLTGIDINPVYLDFAKKVYSNSLNIPTFFCADALDESAITFGQWDIVILSSAYHHIDDNRKTDFLKHIHKLLSPQGHVVIAENILPEYEADDINSYRDSVKLFYSEVLNTTKKLNPNLSPKAESLINHVAQYGLDGHTEYKVHYNIFKDHMQEAQLEIISENKVWPFTEEHIGTKGGNYVFLAKKN